MDFGIKQSVKGKVPLKLVQYKCLERVILRNFDNAFEIDKERITNENIQIQFSSIQSLDLISLISLLRFFELYIGSE